MPNIPIKAKIRCPYFLRLGGSGPRGGEVVCEGLIPGSEIRNCFGKSADCREWVEGVCTSYDYAQRCQVARTNEAKYGSAEKGEK